MGDVHKRAEDAFRICGPTYRHSEWRYVSQEYKNECIIDMSTGHVFPGATLPFGTMFNALASFTSLTIYRNGEILS